jgi:hypothetical protein
MAIDAAHVTLLDLGEHARPPPVTDKPTNLRKLPRPIAMVELQRDHVRVAAVDAWMRDEVDKDLPPILLSTSLRLNDRAADVVGLVGHVVGVSIGRVTRAAIRIQDAKLFIGE